MPLKIPNDLPAVSALEAEGVSLIRESDAVRQNIRPLRIGLLNLMPNKIRTETQIARLLAPTPLQVELSLIRITDHGSRNTSEGHLSAFYRPWADVRTEKFDGFVITGAPLGMLKYEEVRYWEELTEIFEWTQTHVHSTLNLCWAAQASLYHFYGIPTRLLPKKAFGVFPHLNRVPNSPYLRGFADNCVAPISRRTEIRQEDFPPGSDIRVLLDSPEAGLCMLEDLKHRSLCMFSHIEYDADTLREEYVRDVAKNLAPAVPFDYFPGDDPERAPLNRWKSHAYLLFANWLGEIYQTTPYEIDLIGGESQETLRV
ncbi:homoserine O-succinyltransferase [Burkholderia sp. 22PA0099]|uniref:homoserine O-succinyltransferase n=1 Tax=Burkholderia sp. 22PA0099 TaxID=3237372 RepID=UPI0039C1316E